jgi:hypothetical protein
MDQGIETASFLEASDGLVKMFGKTTYSYGFHILEQMDYHQIFLVRRSLDLCKQI